MQTVLIPAILFLLVLFGPLWLCMLYGAVCLFLIRQPYSVILAALLADVLYYGGGVPEHASFAMMVPLSVWAIVLAVLAHEARERIRTQA